MHLPHGVQMADGSRGIHVLKILKSIYGQKQADRVWYNHLKEGLLRIAFTQLAIDECVFYVDKTMFLCYIDDGIFALTDQEDIDQAIKDLTNDDFYIEDKGDIEDYLGMTIEKLSDGRIRIAQLQIIQLIIDEVCILPGLKEKGSLASATRLLTRELDAPKFDGRFHYR
eukprot:15367107-Ditylum_brightwellii.AAC.3